MEQGDKPSKIKVKAEQLKTEDGEMPINPRTGKLYVKGPYNSCLLYTSPSPRDS